MLRLIEIILLFLVMPEVEEAILFGHNLQPREKTDPASRIGYIVTEASPVMTVTKAGSIKKWKLFSQHDSDVTMMALRPVKEDTDRYMLVGENSVSIRGGIANFFNVDAFDMIKVQPGDIIAWYYLPGQNPGIP